MGSPRAPCSSRRSDRNRSAVAAWLRGGSLRAAVEHDVIGLEVGFELVTRLEVAREQVAGERIDHELLERTLERARTVDRIVASLGDARDCPVGQLQGQLALGEQLVEPAKLDPDDPAELG